MIHQDRITSRTRERERDQTHSYWYIPLAPRENYSLLVMESTGMMKMATGEGFPFRQGAGMGLELFLVATEACGGGTPDLYCVLKVSGHVGIYGCRRYVRGATGAPRGRGRALGGWARPHPRGPLVAPLSDFFRLYISIYPKNIREHNRSGVSLPEASVATENQSRPVPAPCQRGQSLSGVHLHHPGALHDEEGVVLPRG